MIPYIFVVLYLYITRVIYDSIYICWIIFCITRVIYDSIYICCIIFIYY